MWNRDVNTAEARLFLRQTPPRSRPCSSRRRPPAACLSGPAASLCCRCRLRSLWWSSTAAEEAQRGRRSNYNRNESVTRRRHECFQSEVLLQTTHNSHFIKCIIKNNLFKLSLKQGFLSVRVVTLGSPVWDKPSSQRSPQCLCVCKTPPDPSACRTCPSLPPCICRSERKTQVLHKHVKIIWWGENSLQLLKILWKKKHIFNILNDRPSFL